MSLETTKTEVPPKPSFREELKLQRWDDHRYYHHSRVNQSLHLVSAVCFMTCYALLFFDPGAAALLGWFVAMCSRQIGHFFFEPRTYDDVNHASHQHKEQIKVGYNLHRKRVLQSIWAISPLMLYLNPGFFGLFQTYATWGDFIENLAILWLGLAVVALLFRTVHLFFIEDVQTGLVWATKILTDPFNDFKTYCKSPFYLMRGEWIDPMRHVQHGAGSGAEEQEALAR
jgi:hypothetical protein